MKMVPISAELFDLDNTPATHHKARELYPILGRCVEALAVEFHDSGHSIDLADANERTRALNVESQTTRSTLGRPPTQFIAV